ncbi:DUF6364 family protein [Treponema primitia]|uniref:DUF6364 family protein n=1 Tax=Treponema primitia TaxID=88058 RepID=UPI003980C7B4
MILHGERIEKLAYLDSRHRSLSKIVENYFRNLTQKPSPEKKFSPVVEALLGAVPRKK